MFLHQLDLTTALRPSLLPEETLLFVQDAVGLYEGKFKIPQYQHGQAYLTSHRVCYVDHAEPRKNSVAIFLKDVEKTEFYAGFLKSSAKITLLPQTLEAAHTRSVSPNRCREPDRGDSAPTQQPCTSTTAKRYLDFKSGGALPLPSANGMVSCPRCTLENHPSLSTCEICGAPLTTAVDRRLDLARDVSRPESPGPSLAATAQSAVPECIKVSFRQGGEKIFHERLKNALVQRKWLLHSAPPIPKPRPASGAFEDNYSIKSDQSSAEPERPRVVGIAGLERRGLEQRQNNEAMIGSAFEDLEALMTSAKEIIALAEQFASQANIGSNGNSEASVLASQSASALGLVTTKDMLGTGSGSESLEGGIMTLVDLWAVFNRARGGVELVSPSDFEKAARMWDTLKLPVRLRQFKSGLLVVQGRDRTDEKTIASLLAWLHGLHDEPPSADVTWDWQMYGRGVTAQETAERFGWSVGVATEELEMAEEAGALCREQGLDGFRFWENWLVKLSVTSVDA
ncbi:hypothetical protein SNOG_12776 [Parastagonospora nodorum SN15]|uniref:Vacuolar protein-sorting-associated protein 36 n=1 Tax=Phaeosphaeria nodorum (strain SN15 / ATCC MYA-4574 / FGSC 10173) TaxID=321614 RepID=Q0U638_PHANO|nr:hypothetical protein SNOG_12776 [Parastagonospora nodorum SN15]EAT80074.2 hypothetical protein SNOG_12776 [Parastagonospora nodorum SN15]